MQRLSVVDASDQQTTDKPAGPPCGVGTIGLTVILPVIHLILCGLPIFIGGEWAMWGWIVPMIIDWPISKLMLVPNRGWLSLVVVGTLWWFFLNVCIYWGFRVLMSRVRR